MCYTGFSDYLALQNAEYRNIVFYGKRGHLLIEVPFVLAPLWLHAGLPLKLLISAITVPENMECKDLKIQDKQKEYH